MGPWRAAQRFLNDLPPPGIEAITELRVDLYGSLAKTGRGHGTPIAVQLGLLGEDPELIDVSTIGSCIERLAKSTQLRLQGEHSIPFDPAKHIQFHSERLKAHPNGIRFTATLKAGSRHSAVYFSIGGGFIVGEDDAPCQTTQALPYPIDSARALLDYCDRLDCSISGVVMLNELAWRSKAEILERLEQLHEAMIQSVFRGCQTEGMLPGGLGVQRRAAQTARRLLGDSPALGLSDWLTAIRNAPTSFQRTLDWVSCFALAVNEENAAFGRIVTAPTNGAAGVIPAVLLYTLLFCEVEEDAYVNFLLTAGEIGSLFKKGATISAAMGGCQAEIGVSSAMAAAALTEALGGAPQQATVAAEIAMEHHLGMTCDPIGGLVQIPCIERNAFGAIKAIAAAQLALQRTPTDACVSLDAVIQTMWQTAQDMSEKYKETSEGGLAVQIAVNVSEC